MCGEDGPGREAQTPLCGSTWLGPAGCGGSGVWPPWESAACSGAQEICPTGMHRGSPLPWGWPLNPDSMAGRGFRLQQTEIGLNFTSSPLLSMVFDISQAPGLAPGIGPVFTGERAGQLGWKAVAVPCAVLGWPGRMEVGGTGPSLRWSLCPAGTTQLSAYIPLVTLTRSSALPRSRATTRAFPPLGLAR